MFYLHFGGIFIVYFVYRFFSNLEFLYSQKVFKVRSFNMRNVGDGVYKFIHSFGRHDERERSKQKERNPKGFKLVSSDSIVQSEIRRENSAGIFSPQNFYSCNNGKFCTNHKRLSKLFQIRNKNVHTYNI